MSPGSTKPHVVTTKTKSSVKALKSFGVTHEEIAEYLDIDADTLVKYYKRDLQTSVVKANRKVARCLFRNATDNMDVTSQIFWLKTRARWRTEDSRQAESSEEALREIKKFRDEWLKENKKEY